jgi:hypothetical protein
VLVPPPIMPIATTRASNLAEVITAPFALTDALAV